MRHAVLALIFTALTAAASETAGEKPEEEPAPSCTVSVAGASDAGDLYFSDRMTTGRLALSPPPVPEEPVPLVLLMNLAEPAVIDSIWIEYTEDRIPPDEIMIPETYAVITRSLEKPDRHVAVVPKGELRAEFPPLARGLESAVLCVRARTHSREIYSTVLPARGLFEYRINDAVYNAETDGKVDREAVMLEELPAVTVCGHPDGIIRVYTGNDFDTLYFCIDCIPDNTGDSSDSAVITLHTEQGERSFTVKPGDPGAGFHPSPGAEYPHRIYEFSADIIETLGTREQPVRFSVAITGIGLL
jgi:hypothetical protein